MNKNKITHIIGDWGFEPTPNIIFYLKFVQIIINK